MELLTPCQHCTMDPHTSDPPRVAVIQVLGVWLCYHHYDTAKLVNGVLLRPETAREMESLL